MRRSGAGAGLPVLIAAAAGCGAPISNGVFLEEAQFLGALPTTARLGAPQSVLFAPAGDATVLEAAKRAATDWDDGFGLLGAAGERLREADPDAATAVKRTWDSVPVARRIVGESLGRDPGVIEYFAQAEILRPEAGDASWTLALAPEAGGPWTGVATGTHRVVDGVGSGELTFDLTSIAVVVGGEPEAPLGVWEVSYADVNADYDGLRSVDAAQTVLPGVVLSHGLVGDAFFAFSTGALEVTDDGVERFGYAAVAHDERGGWGEGVVQGDAEDEVWAFETCWNTLGGLIWQGGDPRITAAGTDLGACPVQRPFDR